MFKKIKNWIVVKWKYLLAILGLSVGIVFAAGELPKENLGNSLDLKAPKENILYSNEYTEYEYDEEGEIISQKQIVSYAYKSGELAHIINQEYTEYEYQKDADGKIILDAEEKPIVLSQRQIVTYEILEKRTKNIIISRVETSDGSKLFSAQSGYNFYQENGEWKQVEFATTTKKAFEIQTISFWDRFIALADLSEGPTSPNTMAQEDVFASIGPWSNIDNSKISDDNYTVSEWQQVSSYTYHLNASDFGFSIPTEEDIVGILLEVEVRFNQAPSAFSSLARLIKNGSYTGGYRNNNNVTTEDVSLPMGSSSDLWDTTWTPAEINAFNFGVAYLFNNQDSNAVIYLYVDHLRITVFYTGEPIDTCTATASPWNVQLSDSCNITDYQQVDGILNCFGSGSFVVKTGGTVVAEKMNCPGISVQGTGKIIIKDIN